AARAWWLLRHAGVDARILDGGLAAWTAAGGALETGPARRPERGDVSLSWGHLDVVDIDDAAAAPSHGVLIDARAAVRVRGDSEPVDPVAGHIPGAVNVPTADNVGPDGRFRRASVLAARFAAVGVTPDSTVVAYCGSGVTAAHEIAALEIAGIRAALFPGSWSQWSTTPDRPVATGDSIDLSLTLQP
ncbi:MAG: sulfurtransferase, partial [Demequina sp.]|uniref:sulfurtransferase n=1 Tax=Demequina sp. TaxID=2050685 RepID=UPI003A8A9D79